MSRRRLVLMFGLSIAVLAIGAIAYVLAAIDELLGALEAERW